MADEDVQVLDKDGWLLKDLWEKYEEIAMHFNDLLLRLRTQALAGVAAVTAVVGLFGKDAAKDAVSWELATGVFVLLAVFWIAIFVIDIFYYNRLLVGAVAAILELEELSKKQSRVLQIAISTKIEAAVAGDVGPLRKGRLLMSIKAFYVIVFAALVGGAYFSWKQYQSVQTTPAAKTEEAPKPKVTPTQPPSVQPNVQPSTPLPVPNTGR